jgi:hypothetical protein
VQRTLFDLALGNWDVATPQMKAWVLQHWQRAEGPEKQALLANAQQRGRADVLTASLPTPAKPQAPAQAPAPATSAAR